MALRRRADQSQATRDYPPLAVAALCALALLAVLPSSLNLPQSDPAETLEYAPVPPEDSIDTPPSGNLAALGTGSTRTLGSTGETAAGPIGAVGGRAIKTPATKRCVGSPPRQTEDPLSPPCVASFTGDNGGSTYQGVAADEVRVLFAFGGGDGCTACSSNSPETAPRDTYIDLGQPPPEDPNEEYVDVRSLRVWQRYFNDRYQTYNRRVRLFVHYGSGTRSTEASRAQAIDNYKTIKPFAASAGTTVADPTAYTDIVASKGVVSFTDLDFVSSSTFSRAPGQIWNYPPSLELRAAIFGSHVCTKVVPHPVSDSGNAGENGAPRRLGLIHSQSSDPAYVKFWRLVKSTVERCGGRFVAEGTYPRDAYVSSNQTYAAPVMADFRDRGVTTIIWAGGEEPNFSKAAKAIAYFPEWVIAGTGLAVGNLNGQGQDQDVWDHAWMVTDAPLVDQSGVTNSCATAYAEAGGIDHPLERNYACTFFYDTMRQIFTGIQVAGPKLTVRNLDKGYHAIPPRNSPRPDLPACFYLPGDYTCVKDHTVMWWDSTAQAGIGKGCYRMAEGGRRYREGTWPEGNLDAQRRPDDVCNNYTGGGNIAL